MDSIMRYYTSVSIVIALVQFTMVTIVLSNHNISNKKKYGFMTTFVLLFLASSFEWGSVILENFVGDNVVILRKVAKWEELSIAPIIMIGCATNIFAIKVQKVELYLARALLTVHTIFELISIKFGYIFMVTDQNEYYHGTYYWIYIVVLAISILYLLSKIILFCKWFQNQNLIVIACIFVLACSGVFMRLLNNFVRNEWLVANIAMVFVYIYFNEITMYTDQLTTLLNQRSYKNYISTLNSPATIVIFDIDDFKLVNDQYGHIYGDQVIATIGRCIRETFGQNGKCFRIGGDEFACILLKELNSVEEMASELKKCLEIERKKDNRIPQISYGSARYDSEYQHIEDIINLADADMYKNKKIGKGIK